MDLKKKENQCAEGINIDVDDNRYVFNYSSVSEDLKICFLQIIWDINKRSVSTFWSFNYEEGDFKKL